MQKGIDRKVLMTGMIILGVIVVALILSSSGFFGTNTSNTVSATGESTIKVAPDFVSIDFNVQTTDLTANGASDKNSEIVTKMKNSLMNLGFEEDEIKTESFSVYPDYDWVGGTQRIKSYSASHLISIEVDISEKEMIGKVIDAGIDSGAGIYYINYELTQENQNTYKVEAIRAATEDAKVKATALAEGAGQELGRLVSVSTSEFGYLPWGAYTSSDSGVVKSGAEIATTITPSEQEISARVVAVFKIR